MHKFWGEREDTYLDLRKKADLRVIQTLLFKNKLDYRKRTHGYSKFSSTKSCTLLKEGILVFLLELYYVVKCIKAL